MKCEYETISYSDSLPAKIEVISTTGYMLYGGYHWHKDVELVYILNGSLTITKNYDECVLNNGDVHILNSGEIHQITAEGNDDIQYVSVHLSYDFIKKFESMIDYYSFVIVPISRPELEIKRFMRELSDIELSEFQQYSVVMKILHVLFTHCLKEKRVSSYGNCKVSFRNAKVAMEYIEKHYRDKLNLNVMSNVLELHPTYFSKYFKETMGVGFNTYVTNIRLKHALDDLNISGLSIADVARFNGFPNIKSFENACKRSYGLTPLQLKKRRATSFGTERSNAK